MNAPERFFELRNVLGICPHAYLDFVAESIEVRTKEQFVSFVKNALQPIFPHGMMLAGLGQVLPTGIFVQHAIGINYPCHYLSKLEKCPIFAGPILSQWLETLEPQLFEIQRPAASIPKRWLTAVQRASIQNIAAHGVRDANGPGASYFTFSEIPAPLGVQQRFTLSAVVPHLHLALSRIVAMDRRVTANNEHKQTTSLTPREQEILYWISHGKRDAEIAKTINRSIFTVNNHVKNILIKLGVKNRFQALSIAAKSDWQHHQEPLNSRENS